MRAIPTMMKLGLRLFKLPKPPEALVRVFALMLKPSLRLFQLLKPREALGDAGPQCTCAFDPEDDYAAPAQAAMPACTSIPAPACSSNRARSVLQQRSHGDVDRRVGDLGTLMHDLRSRIILHEGPTLAVEFRLIDGSGRRSLPPACVRYVLLVILHGSCQLNVGQLPGPPQRQGCPQEPHPRQ